MFKVVCNMINLKMLVLSNFFYRLFNKNKFENELTIISSKNWRNRVKEDVVLQRYLLEEKIDTKIMAFEKGIPKTKCILIRSIWGYQNELDEFYKYLDELKKENKILINDYELINNNFDKKKQFDLLDKYEIPHIGTEFVYNASDLKKILKSGYVVKPIISASGNDTYIVDGDYKNSLSKSKIISKFKNLKTGIMVQPFVEEIKSGEYAVVLFNGEVSHAVIRFPGVFTDKPKLLSVSVKALDNSLLNLIEEVKKIKEYQEAVYMRVDAVKVGDSYHVMEIELLEPQLFFEWIIDLDEREKAYKKFVQSIKEKLN